MESTENQQKLETFFETTDDKEQPFATREAGEKLFETSWTEIVENFEDLNLKNELIKGMFDCGLVKPSKMQQKAIKPIISKKDVIIKSQSGSGKTAIHVIGVLQNIDHEDHKCQGVIITPNKELAIGIAHFVKRMGMYLKISVHLCIGETPTLDDIKKLNKGVQIVVGTPDRIRDLMNRRIISQADLKMLIIDEVDEIFGLGLQEQTSEIIKMITHNCQICLFSATISAEIIKFSEDFTSDPVKIEVKEKSLTLDDIEQSYLQCSNEINKYEKLFEILTNIDIKKSIVFVNTKDKAERLTQVILEKGFNVSCIHGSMNQEKRNVLIKEFCDGSLRILISTDLLARGIHDYQVELIINFELPSKKENYIHRIGRSSTSKRRCVAINLISAHEVNYLNEIQDFYHTQITEFLIAITEIGLTQFLSK
jgi:translation initiation factor 4A